MQTNANAQRDLDTLTALNLDFFASVEKGDVKRFEEILADDFMSSYPDGSLHDKAEFLVRCGKVRIFSGCKSRPATQSLQPVAIGAAVEVTNPPKPPMRRVALATPRAGRP